ADRHPPQPDSATTSETSPPTTPSRATDAACRAQLRLRAGGPRQLPPIVEGRRPTRAPRQLSLDFATHSPTTSGHRHLSLDRTGTDTGPSYLKFGAFDLPPRPWPGHVTTGNGGDMVVVSVDAAAIAIMKPAPTHIKPLPPQPKPGATHRAHRQPGTHRLRPDPPPHEATPRNAPGLSLPVRVLLVLTYVG